METPITDPITGQWAGTQLISHLTAELARAREAGMALSVAVVDIDDFAVVTQRCDADDRISILKAVAARLRASLRKTDAVGRYAGEEFLIVLDPASRGQTNAFDPVPVMERVRQAVAAEPIETTQGPISVTVSIGVATACPQTDHPAALISAAVQAAYRAKIEGNCVRLSRLSAWI